MIQHRECEDISSESRNQLINELEEHFYNPSPPLLKQERESGHSPERHKAASQESTEANNPFPEKFEVKVR